jgi:hypothetical protein
MRGFVAACGVFVSAACFGQPTGLVSLWSAEGDAADSAGPNDGAIVNAVGFAPGVVGEGFLFQQGGYVSVADPVGGGLQSASGFTVAAWIRLDGFPSTSSIVNLRVPSNTSGFTLENQFVSPGTLLFAVNTTGGWDGFQFLSSPGWESGVVYHIAASFDAATGSMKVYRDGTVVSSRDDLNDSPMAGDPAMQFEIGRNVVTSTLFSGLLDEIGFFDHALADGDVAYLVQAGLIRGQPKSVTTCPGDDVTFEVDIREAIPATFQWRHDGKDIDGAKSRTLVLPNVQDKDEGEYRCLVSNDVGDVLSDPAVLVVCPPDLTCDGVLDLFDFLSFVNLFNAQDATADCDGDGAFTLFDFLCFVNQFNAGC